MFRIGQGGDSTIYSDLNVVGGLWGLKKKSYTGDFMKKVCVH